MFTGIIQAIGSIATHSSSGVDSRFYIKTGDLSLENLKLGDSVAVNGVCLTVVELLNDGFWADVSAETLAKTAFKKIKTTSKVNLEKALLASSPLGGHIVSGHVDGIGEIVQRKDVGRSVQFSIKAAAALARYIAAKGSITVDGVSLTVNKVDGCVFELNIVPHTLENTIMGQYKAGDEVNLEVDIIARYLERLLLADRASIATGENATAENKVDVLTVEMLARNGFI